MKTLARISAVARSLQLLQRTVKNKVDRHRYRGWRLERERRREI